MWALSLQCTVQCKVGNKCIVNKRCRKARLNFRNKMQYSAFSACFKEVHEKKIDVGWRIL